MPATRGSTQRSAKPSGGRQKAKPTRISRSQPGAPAAKPGPMVMPPVEALKKTIALFYLLSFCPPGRITEWARCTAPVRAALAASAGMSEGAYFKMTIPEVCRRIVSYHQSTREPSPEWIETLTDAAGQAAAGPKEASAFQQAMLTVARLPQRAQPQGRLHRNKGCQFCQAPCSYGYFTLISDPQFTILQDLFAAEARKPVAEQSPWNPCFGFTLGHIQGLAGVGEEFVAAEHLVNLSYCLLMLATAKSRLPVPERQLRLFQQTSQAFVEGGRIAKQAKLN